MPELTNSNGPPVEELQHRLWRQRPPIRPDGNPTILTHVFMYNGLNICEHSPTNTEESSLAVLAGDDLTADEAEDRRNSILLIKEHARNCLGMHREDISYWADEMQDTMFYNGSDDIRFLTVSLPVEWDDEADAWVRSTSSIRTSSNPASGWLEERNGLIVSARTSAIEVIRIIQEHFREYYTQENATILRCGSCSRSTSTPSTMESWRDPLNIASIEEPQSIMAPLCGHCRPRRENNCWHCGDDLLIALESNPGSAVTVGRDPNNEGGMAWAFCNYCIANVMTYECIDCSTIQVLAYPRGIGMNARDFRCPSCVTTWQRIESAVSVHDYGYKPEPVFFPAEDLPQGDGLYLGMELECCASGVQASRAARTWFAKEVLDSSYKEFLYMKSDSSLDNGVEVVTHPFTPDWGKSDFPTNIIEKLYTEYGFEKEHRTAGTHIHLSKDAFSEKHLWRFIQLHNYMDEFCGRIGGRGHTHHQGPLFPYDDAYRKQDAHPHWIEKVEYAARNKRSATGWGRDGINFQPTHTIELRYPKGSLDPLRIKGLIEWVDAIYAFTSENGISDQMVSKGVLNTPNYLIGFIKDEQTEWPNLWELVEANIWGPANMSELGEN